MNESDDLPKQIGFYNLKYLFSERIDRLAERWNLSRAEALDLALQIIEKQYHIQTGEQDEQAIP